MAISLYDVSVTSFLQTLGGVGGFLDRGASHFLDNNVDADAFAETRLFPDMLPFRYQVLSVAHHSLGAIEGVKKGSGRLMGFGHHHRVHERRMFGLSGDRPVTITAVDTEEKIREIIPEVRSLVPDSLILLLGAEQLSV